MALLVVAGCLWALGPACRRAEDGQANPGPATVSTQPSPTELANLRQFLRESDRPAHMPLTTTKRSATTLTYQAAPDWQKQLVRTPPRVDQYRLPRAEGDPEDGELTVSTGVGGSVEANLARWRSQFTGPDGQPLPDDAFHVKPLIVHDLRVTLVDVAGRYKGADLLPGMPPSIPKDNYRMLGAIVETPDGLWYFKALGPAATIARHQEAFLGMLHSMGLRQVTD